MNECIYNTWKNEINQLISEHYKDGNTEISQELTYKLACKAKEYYLIDKQRAKNWIEKLKREAELEGLQNGYPLFYADATSEEIDIMNTITNKSLLIMEELKYE